MIFFNLMVLCMIFIQTHERPAHDFQDYKDSKENTDRDSDNGDSEDYLHNEEKSSLKQFSGNREYKKSEILDELSSNVDEEAYHARPDKDYLESNDEEQANIEHFSHRDNLSSGKSNKRAPSSLNGIMLFHDNEKPRKLKKMEYQDESKLGSEERCRYLNQNMISVDQDTVNRERRQLKNENVNQPLGSVEISTQQNELIANEDEEKTIRRHVKSLSKEELEELLESLSEDKRALLKNIIDSSQQEYDSINKREITKKSGTNEENSFVGNEQPEASKMNAGSANLESDSSMVPDTEKEDNTKKSDIESVSSKSSDIENSSEKSNSKVNTIDAVEDKKLVKTSSIDNLESSLTKDNILASPEKEQELYKKQNKREINLESLGASNIENPSISRSSNKENMYCLENEELPRLWDDETNLHNANKNKREICLNNLDSIKSLEESFANIGSTNDIESGLDMTPLIRVKRTQPDKILKRRDVNVLSDIKVPYFSSALENNDEDSDEGSEFQEEGYFDRAVSGAKGELVRLGIDSPGDNKENYLKYCKNSQPTHIKLEDDTVGLGSDTDVVLSGIEGVDDNMMYNSVRRIKRSGESLDNINIEDGNRKIKHEKMQQVGSQYGDNEMSEEDSHAPRYQENDAFGSLPRNYEQDLGRFKRIRRLKTDSNGSVAEN